MRKRVRIFVTVAILAAFLYLASLIIAGFLYKDRLTDVPSKSISMEEAFSDKNSRSKSKGITNDIPEVTPASDPKLEPILTKLRLLERNRYTFCREWESDDEIVNEFILKKPSQAELKEINEIISDARGLTFDDDHFVVSWQQKLREDFLFSNNDCDQFIVSITFGKKSNRGHYAILGVPEGEP